MKTPRFLVTREIPDPGPSILDDAGDVEIRDGMSADELREAVTGGEYDVVVSQVSDRFDSELLSEARIRGIANYAVGYNNIDVVAAAEHGIAVGNTPDVLNDATANTAMLLLLGAARRAHEAAEYLRDGKFTGIGPKLLVGQDVTGATLGIAGMGRIGKAVARTALQGGDLVEQPAVGWVAVEVPEAFEPNAVVEGDDDDIVAGQRRTVVLGEVGPAE